MRRRAFLKSTTAASCLVAAGGAPSLRAQEGIKLRISHFVPPMHIAHTQLLAPWAERIERDSGGRIRCEIYPSMQLGGKPPQLIEQVRSGIADLVWTVPAYTPGRFPLSSVFELPFVVGRSALATSQAIWSFYKNHLREEYKDLQPLLLHAHAPGGVHMREGLVQRLEDVRGRKLRLPSRPIADAFQLLGATPVGMPASEAYEALSRALVDGITLPWEAMKSFRLNELTRYHTATGLYTTVFLVAMNKARYESLPAELREVIDRNSGDHWIREAGRIWDEAEAPGLQQAQAAGHTITQLSAEETSRWRHAMQPVANAWIAATPGGKTLYDEALASIDRHSA